MVKILPAQTDDNLSKPSLVTPDYGIGNELFNEITKGNILLLLFMFARGLSYSGSTWFFF